MLVYCQIGFRKNLQGGCILSVHHNDVPVDIKESSDNGQYLTGIANRHSDMWYLKPIECNNGDVIKLECKSGLRGRGPDEEKSFTALFVVDDTVNDDSFNFAGIGVGHGIPLLKGKVKRLSVMTVKERRLEEGKAKLGEEHD